MSKRICPPWSALQTPQGGSEGTRQTVAKTEAPLAFLEDLRLVQPALEFRRRFQPQCVITSYSIHYTKLYDHLGHRRQELVLSTKLGYDMAGHADWSYGSVQAGVEAALKRLNTDRNNFV